MQMKYTNYEHVHPILRAMLAFNDYDYDDDEIAISTTSVMKPVHMIALERANKASDREINIEGMIPSVGGTSLHNMLETALNKADDELWKALGIKSPDKLEILTEIRKEKEMEDFKLTGKFDVMYKYLDSKWQLGDLKSLSVWAVMIDPDKKKEEWRQQLSIYRYLNQDKDIDDIAMIFTWFTDWSKTDARAKAAQGYPQSRIGHITVDLWSLDETERYLKGKLSGVKAALDRYEKTGETGVRCSEDELWAKKEQFAYFKKKDGKRATKVYDTFDEANDRLISDGSRGFVEHRPGEKTRCKYCAVLNFCQQGQEYRALGLVPEL